MNGSRRRFLAGTAMGSTGLWMDSQSLPAAAGAGAWQASGPDFPQILHHPKAAAPVAYAADGLRHYLGLALGSSPDSERPPGSSRIVLEEVSRADLGEEGFELLCQGRDLFIRGTASGVVYGAFDFLRRHVGCRFTGYAPDGEEIPRRDTIALAPFHAIRKPQLWYRGYQLAWREPLELVVKRLDWMAKNGLNYVMYTPLPDDVTDAIGGAIGPNVGDAMERSRWRYHESWFREHVQPEVLRRGLKLDFNHHNLAYWLPSERYFDRHPEWYALIKGRRQRQVDHTQLSICTSNEEGVETLVGNVLAFLRANPAVGIVGVNPEDGIGMCQCERCLSGDLDRKDATRVYTGDTAPSTENASKSRRYAGLVNRVARAVKKEFPDRLVAQTAYNDIRWPPRGMTLEPNVVTIFTAGGRDVAQPLSPDSPAAPNRYLFETLRQWRRTQPCKIILYTYYMGTHAMRSAPHPITEAICREWPHLKRLGIGGATVQCWSSNHEMYALNNLAFARSGWEDEVDVEDLLDDYLKGTFGRAEAQVRPLFERLNEAMRALARARTGAFPSIEYLLDHVGEEALARAARPVTGGREEVQIRHLGAVIEYWRRYASIMRLRARAVEAEKAGRADEAAALYAEARPAIQRIVLYINALPQRGWISITTPAAWHENTGTWGVAKAKA